MTQVANSIKKWTNNHRLYIFPLLAFIIPLIVRTIPEILMGPYIVGFDTLGFYVPDTLLWLHGTNLLTYLANAPLFYVIFAPLVAAGASPIFVTKILSPMLLGFLGLTIYLYARKGLDWSFNKSIVPALLGTLYFVALRVSWDMLRNEIALIFFFVVLTLLGGKHPNSWKRYVLLSLAMTAVVLSDQLGAVIMLGVVIFTIIFKLLQQEFIQATKLIVVSLPSAVYFVIVYLTDLVMTSYFNNPTNVISPLASWTGFASYQSMIVNEAGFFLYCFLPLLPLIVIGLWRFGNVQLRSWLLLSLILVLLPIASVSPYRWVLMLMFPLAFYTTEALSRLKSIKWKHYNFTIHRIAILYLVLSTAILSFGFIFMTSSAPFFYFSPSQLNFYPYQIPTSMLQNTISITDCKATANVLQWFKDNTNSSALLLTHTVFYGWALLTLNMNQVRNYGFEDPTQAAMTAAEEGHGQIYLIWWVNGHGWYDQPTLPSAFHEVYSSGQIVIYSYSSN